MAAPSPLWLQLTRRRGASTKRWLLLRKPVRSPLRMERPRSSRETARCWNIFEISVRSTSRPHNRRPIGLVQWRRPVPVKPNGHKLPRTIQPETGLLNLPGNFRHMRRPPRDDQAIGERQRILNFVQQVLVALFEDVVEDLFLKLRRFRRSHKQHQVLRSEPARMNEHDQ